jgi:glycosyltransferase involved in cell wall biosynthesis
MQTNVPIITSNVTSMPEIAGDAALLINPLEVLELKNAMMQLLEKPELRADLILKGNSQKQKFSWEKSADLLWRSVLKTVNSN